MGFFNSLIKKYVKCMEILWYLDYYNWDIFWQGFKRLIECYSILKYADYHNWQDSKGLLECYSILWYTDYHNWDMFSQDFKGIIWMFRLSILWYTVKYLLQLIYVLTGQGVCDWFAWRHSGILPNPHQPVQQCGDLDLSVQTGELYRPQSFSYTKQGWMGLQLLVLVGALQGIQSLEILVICNVLPICIPICYCYINLTVFDI